MSCQSGGMFANTPMLEATFLKFVRENATTHITGLNRKRNGTVKYMEVPNKNVRDIMDGLAYTNPYIARGSQFHKPEKKGRRVQS